MDERLFELLQEFLTVDDVCRIVCEFMNKRHLDSLVSKGIVDGHVYRVVVNETGRTMSGDS